MTTQFTIFEIIFWNAFFSFLTINTLATSSLFDLDTALLNPVTDDYTTADTYALDRLNTKLEHLLKQQRKLGKKFLTDNDIDQIIDTILKKYV